MKKILSISILLIIIINLFCSSHAYELGTKEVKLLNWSEIYLRYDGNAVPVPVVGYSNDGGSTYLPAYCLKPNSEGIDNGLTSYNVNVEGKLTNEAVWKVLINGYPYKSLSDLKVDTIDQAFYATKMAAYVASGLRLEENYTARSSNDAAKVYNAFRQILEDARNCTEVLANNDKISIVQENDWLIENDYLSKTYKLNSVIKDGTFKLELTGNLPEGSRLVDESFVDKIEFNLNEKFKILIPIDKIDEIYDFNLKATSRLKTYPILYGKSTIEGKQDYALVGETHENVSCNLSDKTIKNTTKIKIIKKEYGSEKRLAGVKFNLLDSNKSILQKDLISDDAGEIEISKLLPGKYYVQEVETLEGYNKYSELVEVNITLNEEVEVIVNNTLKSVNEISKETETIEIIENQTENVYKTNAVQTNFTTNNVKKLPVTGY